MLVLSVSNHLPVSKFEPKQNKINANCTNQISFQAQSKTCENIPQSSIEDCFGEGYTLNPTIKKMLDESKFLIDTKDGTELLSIKDAVGKFILSDWGDIDIPTMYHACSTYETVDKIISRGFEPQYISRTMYGPGYYFTGAEGDARNYGGAILTAELKGHCACLDKNWYDAISTKTVTDKIMNFTRTDYENSKAILNEYVRRLMYEDLGIDLAYCFGNQVCFNPDAIQNMHSQKGYR